jgi:hypothetical protein
MKKAVFKMFGCLVLTLYGECIGMASSADIIQSNLPLSGSTPLKISTKQSLWEYGETEKSVERVEYRLYGDSLLSETVGNRREWYALKNDSALWLREETPLLTLTPTESIPVNGFGMSKEISDIHEFTAHGIYSNDIPITEWGKITPMPSVTGQLIINNDTKI